MTDVSPTQVPLDQFLNHISFTGERYEVSLPWKEGQLNFSDHYILSLNRLRSLHHHLLKDSQILNVTRHEKTGLMYTKYTSSYYGPYLLYCLRY